MGLVLAALTEASAGILGSNPGAGSSLDGGGLTARCAEWPPDVLWRPPTGASAIHGSRGGRRPAAPLAPRLSTPDAGNRRAALAAHRASQLKLPQLPTRMRMAWLLT